MTKKKIFKAFPHAYVLLFGIIAFMAIMTWIIPAGEYARVQVGGRTIVDPSSFRYIQRSPVDFFKMFVAIPKGINSASALLFMIMIIGASIQLFDSTGAIRAAVFKLLDVIGHQRKSWVIVVIMLFFGCLGAFPGMLEAAIPFAPLCIGIALALGYDVLVGISVPVISIVVGWTAGPTNPWTVGIGQSLAELPLFSGLGYRLVVFVVLMMLAIRFVLVYGERVQRDPALSVANGLDMSHLRDIQNMNAEVFTIRHGFILLTFAVTIFVVVFGAIKWGFGFFEMSAVYIIGSIVGGIIAGYGGNEIAEKLIGGGQSIFVGAIAVGLARGISVVMEEGKIIDTIVMGLARVMDILPPWLSAVGMFIMQTFVNFFIPSGSGQALVTLPIALPVADIINLKRQIAILAFQFGDGLSNLCYPTVGVVIAYLIYTKIPFNTWLKFVMPFVWKAWVAAIALLLIATWIGYGPF